MPAGELLSSWWLHLLYAWTEDAIRSLDQPVIMAANQGRALAPVARAREASMNGYQFWQLWTIGFALPAIGLVPRLLVERTQVLATVGYIIVGATGAGLGVYQLETTPAVALAAPAGDYLTFLGVVGCVVLVVACVRYYRGWSDWLLAHHGAEFLRARRYPQAQTAYERLLARRPDVAAAWYGRGVALLGQGRFVEALACAERTLELAPREARAWVLKANVLMALRRYDEALAAYDRAQQLAPRAAALWGAKGYALEQLGRHAEALDACERALSATRIDATVRGSTLATLATVLNAVGRYTEALAAGEQAARISPRTVRGRLAQAVALERLGRPEEARIAAERGLEAGKRFLADAPANVDVWEAIAMLLHQLGRASEAEAAAVHARELVS